MQTGSLPIPCLNSISEDDKNKQGIRQLADALFIFAGPCLDEARKISPIKPIVNSNVGGRLLSRGRSPNRR